MKPSAFLFFLLGTALPITTAKAETTIDTTNKYAWGANTGWINFRPDSTGTPSGLVFGESYLSGFAYSANTGWINFGDGAPSNHYSYSNQGSDHGVNHDGAGNLSGYAWSANTGWINFSWASESDVNRPTVNLLTGAFSGYAYSANLGWINLGAGLLTTVSMNSEDTDSDGISDQWEWAHFGGLSTADATSDSDGDGVTDILEYAAATNPLDTSDYLKLVSQNLNAGYTEVELDFTSTPNRLYRIEYSADLGKTDPWHDSSLGIFAPDSGTHTTKTITFSGGGDQKYFFRAVAVRPLTP